MLSTSLHHRTVCVPPLLSYPKTFVVTIRKKERKKERKKKHMDNEYRGKAYVIHFLTSKGSLHTSSIKLRYPKTFVSTVIKATYSLR